MDIKTQISSISELRVAEELVRRGCSVFGQMNGKEPFDLVTIINKKIYRVSVKSVLKIKTSGSYSVQLRRIRSNKTKNKIHLFDNKSCDILAIYLHDINKVLFINSNKINQTGELSIRNINTKRSGNCFLVLENDLDNFIKMESCPRGLRNSS